MSGKFALTLCAAVLAALVVPATVLQADQDKPRQAPRSDDPDRPAVRVFVDGREVRVDADGQSGRVILRRERADGERPDRSQARPDGEKKYGYLGIVPVRLPMALAERHGLDDGRGVLVLSVEPGSPAAEGGLKARDAITQIDDQIIYAVEQLQKLVAARRPGAKVRIQVLRDGERQTLAVTLGGTAVRSWGRLFEFEPPPGLELGPRLPEIPDLRDIRPLRPWRMPRPDEQPEAPDRPDQPEPGRSLRLILPDGRELRLEFPSGRELLKSLEPLKEELPPRVWEQLKRMLEEVRIDRPAPEPRPRKDEPRPEPDRPRPEPPRPDRPRTDRPDEQRQIRIRVPRPEGPERDDRPAGLSLATATIVGGGYRATWQQRGDEPARVSLFGRDGRPIFANVTPDRLDEQTARLEPEARELVKRLVKMMGPPADRGRGAVPPPRAVDAAAGRGP